MQAGPGVPGVPASSVAMCITALLLQQRSGLDCAAARAAHSCQPARSTCFLPACCPLQPPNVPVLTVQRMWLTGKQRNGTDVSLVTQLSGAPAVPCLDRASCRIRAARLAGVPGLG